MCLTFFVVICYSAARSYPLSKHLGQPQSTQDIGTQGTNRNQVRGNSIKLDGWSLWVSRREMSPLQLLTPSATWYSSTSLRNRGFRKTRSTQRNSLCWIYCMRESPALWGLMCSFWVTIASQSKKNKGMVPPSAGYRLLQGFCLSRNWKPGTTLSKASFFYLSAMQRLLAPARFYSQGVSLDHSRRNLLHWCHLICSCCLPLSHRSTR